ncbi:hypothetical protein BAE44_0022340, partial [Dichanthelium oligosanthes]
LKQTKEAISTRGPKGKAIIIDVVIGSPSKAQLCLDLLMMAVTTGKQREEIWHRIFLDAGSTRCKIHPVLGVSITH